MPVMSKDLVGVQLEAVINSEAVLPRGALKKKNFERRGKKSANKRKLNLAIHHPAQQRITRSNTAESSMTKYYVRDAWRPYSKYPVQIDTKHVVEQRSIELIDRTEHRRLL